MKIPSFSCSIRRRCVTIVIAFFIIESLILNTVVLVFMLSFHSMVSDIVNAPGGNILDKLSSNPLFKDLVSYGKEGGFRTLVEQSVGRLYVDHNCGLYYLKKSHKYSKTKNNTDSFDFNSVSRIAIDVSHSGEAVYIMKRIELLYATTIPWRTLVVDIGANDGLMSSNSFNFIQCGWSAVLVEPQSYQLDLARRNLFGLTNQHEDQTVHFVNGVVSDQDGIVQFELSKDLVSMESHIVSRGGKTDSKYVVNVESYSVKTLAAKFFIPKRFGILSIDAEGFSNTILYEWLRLGYRPQFIIYEALHESEAVAITTRNLESYNYFYLTKKGWNHIFEYSDR